METIIIWWQVRLYIYPIQLETYKWRKSVIELSADDCALVEAGLKDILSFSPHPEYVQFIYDIGGGFPVFFWPCH